MQDTTIVVRFEGVNLDCVLNDTSDLSTRRGAGLMLLAAAQQTITGLTPVSTGASAAIFTAADEESAKDGIKALNDLAKKDGNALFTFGISAAKADSFAPAENASLSAMRWQQMQMPSFVIPQPSSLRDPGPQVCTVNTTLANDAKIDGKRKDISQSVKTRREYGRTQRQNFYKGQIDLLNQSLTPRPKLTLPPDFQVTDDLQRLSAVTNGSGLEVGNLADKVCLIYADGNSFGKVGAGAAKKGDTGLRKWDTHIKTLRRKMLHALLQTTIGDPRWHTNSIEDCDEDESKVAENRVRLETLLWGGDEFIFVVPAWLGFPAIDFLLSHTQNWTSNETEPSTVLTHSFSAVFSSAKAPIQRTVDLLKKLADKGKQHKKGMNTVTWAALESFDHAGLNVDDYLSRRYPGGKVGWAHWTLTADHFQTVQSSMQTLKVTLPRSQLFAAAQACVLPNVGLDAHKRYEHAIQQITQKVEKEQLDKLWKALSGETFPVTKSQDKSDPIDVAKVNAQQTTAWVQLAELWDYIGLAPLSTPSAGASV
jgi:hypothetical protein